MATTRQENFNKLYAYVNPHILELQQKRTQRHLLDQKITKSNPSTALWILGISGLLCAIFVGIHIALPVVGGFGLLWFVLDADFTRQAEKELNERLADDRAPLDLLQHWYDEPQAMWGKKKLAYLDVLGTRECVFLLVDTATFTFTKEK